MKIDVIIPAYNAHDTIIRCVSSIAMQSIIKDVEVTIVDDASERDYREVVEMFGRHISICQIGYTSNRGPGYAREYGLEHTQNPYVLFIDADDTLHGTFALKILRDLLANNATTVVVSGAFIEETMDGRYLTHNQDMTWMFGKMYKREFLQRYSIEMNDTRSNEDTGFNALVKLCCNAHEQITFCPDIVYVWHAREDSITRINDFDYTFHASFAGYTTNMTWAIQRMWRLHPQLKQGVDEFACEIMAQLYFYYVESVARKPEYAEQNIGWCKKYYDEVYSQIEGQVPEALVVAKYNLAEQGFHALKKNEGYIPKIGYNEFLKLLKDGDNGERKL